MSDRIENHMVVGPDSFDRVVECDHEEWSHGEVEEITHNEISFSITCDSCREHGYVIYRPCRVRYNGNQKEEIEFDTELEW